MISKLFECVRLLSRILVKFKVMVLISFGDDNWQEQNFKKVDDFWENGL